jgi:hypothetical protein
VLAAVLATFAAGQRIGSLAERFTADHAGPRRQWVLGTVLSPSAFVVLSEVVGVRFPPLTSAFGATTTAPTLEAASKLRIRSKFFEREPLPAVAAPLARIRRQVDSHASRVSESRRGLEKESVEAEPVLPRALSTPVAASMRRMKVLSRCRAALRPSHDMVDLEWIAGSRRLTA